MAIDMNALHEMFFAECDEFLGRGEALLEQAGTDWAAVNLAELHRCVHSVRGGADTLGFEEVAALGRALETTLDMVRAGRVRLDSEVLHAARSGLAALRRRLDVVRAGRRDLAGADAQLVSLLRGLCETHSIGEHAGMAESTARIADIEFSIARVALCSEVLIDDMLDTLSGLGELLTVERPEKGARDQTWRIAISSEQSVVALGTVLERLAEPGSLRVEVRAAGAAASAVRQGARLEPCSEACARDASEPVPGAGTPRAQVDTGAESSLRGARVPSRSCLTFVAGGQIYAIDAHRVMEVRPYHGVVRVAGLSGAIRGVIEFDGDFVPVLDLRRFLRVGGNQLSPLTALVCIESGGHAAALVVDRTGEAMVLENDRIRPVPHCFVTGGVMYLAGFAFRDGMTLILLDVDELLLAAGIGPGAATGGTQMTALNAAVQRVRELPDPSRGKVRKSPVASLGAAVVEALDRLEDAARAAPEDGERELGMSAHARLEAYLEDAISTGQTALRVLRDLDHGLRYADRTRDVMVLMLGWIAEMLAGLDPYVDRGEVRATAGTQSGARALRSGRTAPLPKVRRDSGAGGSREDEWEVFRE